jgi:hypothetical protein
MKRKIDWGILGGIVAIIFTIISGLVILVNFQIAENKRTINFKTPEEWAVYYVEKDLGSKSYDYYYSIKEFEVRGIENFYKDGFPEGEYFKMFEIDFLGGSDRDIKIYAFAIQYKKTTYLWGHVESKKISEQNIVWCDLDRIN